MEVDSSNFNFLWWLIFYEKQSKCICLTKLWPKSVKIDKLRPKLSQKSVKILQNQQNIVTEFGQKLILTETFWPTSVTTFPSTYLPGGLWLHYFDRTVGQNSVKTRNFDRIFRSKFRSNPNFDRSVTIKFRPTFFRPITVGQNFGQNLGFFNQNFSQNQCPML